MKYSWYAAVLVIGNEILVGRVLDTNSQKVARALTMLGFDVVEIRKVRDDVEEIAEALKQLLEKASIIITTGGLGPTYDDVTLEGVALALGLPMHLDEEALKMIKEKVEKMGTELTPEREKMAIIPKGAKPIPNPVGVAPGVAILSKHYKIFCLPGVPKEMEEMLMKYVVNYLEKESPMRKEEVCEKLVNVREADIARTVAEFAKKYPDVYIKTHPGVEDGVPVVKVCVLATATTSEDARSKAESILKHLLRQLQSVQK